MENRLPTDFTPGWWGQPSASASDATVVAVHQLGERPLHGEVRPEQQAGVAQLQAGQLRAQSPAGRLGEGGWATGQGQDMGWGPPVRWCRVFWDLVRFWRDLLGLSGICWVLLGFRRDSAGFVGIRRDLFREALAFGKRPGCIEENWCCEEQNGTFTNSVKLGV